MSLSLAASWCRVSFCVQSTVLSQVVTSSAKVIWRAQVADLHWPTVQEVETKTTTNQQINNQQIIPWANTFAGTDLVGEAF